MTQKEKALAHVRSVCPELVEDIYEYGMEEYGEKPTTIRHTPHLEHWLRGLWESSKGTWMLKPVHEGFEFIDMHNFGKRSFKNHYIRYGDTEEFYQAYNQIVEI